MIFHKHDIFAYKCGGFRWCVGTVIHGTMVHWDVGTMGHWNIDTRVLWDVGTLVLGMVRDKCNANVLLGFTYSEYRWYCGTLVYLRKPLT